MNTKYNDKPLVVKRGSRNTFYVPTLDRYLMPSQMRFYTGMSMQDWYDKYVLAIDDVDDRPKCRICGKPAGFQNGARGYAITCGSRQCYLEVDRQNGHKIWQTFSDDKKKAIGQRISTGIKRQIASLSPEERHQRFHVNNSIGQQHPETKRKKSEAMLKFWSQFTEEDKKTLARLSGFRDPESHRKSAEARMSNLVNNQDSRILHTDAITCKGVKTRLYLDKDIFFATNSQQWFTVQSNYELQFVRLLEELHIQYEYSPCAVRYYSNLHKRNRTYTPDFCVFYKDYMIFVEIKSWFKRNAIDVVEKFAALENWTKEQENCICTMMYEGEVYGTAEHLQDVLNNIVSNKWLPAKPGEVVDEQ